MPWSSTKSNRSVPPSLYMSACTSLTGSDVVSAEVLSIANISDATNKSQNTLVTTRHILLICKPNNLRGDWQWSRCGLPCQLISADALRHKNILSLTPSSRGSAPRSPQRTMPPSSLALLRGAGHYCQWSAVCP